MIVCQRTRKMTKTLISGTFFKINYLKLLEIIEKGIETKQKIKSRYRIIGEEINYEDNLHEIYIFSLNSKNKGNKVDDYNIDAEYKGSIEDATIFLEKLATLFQAESIKYEFEYNEIVDDVEGEEYQLYHPDLL